MPRSQANEEVQILRFFEEAPLEKAEMLFNIVKEKIRRRTGETARTNSTSKKKFRDSAPEVSPTVPKTGSL